MMLHKQTKNKIAAGEIHPIAMPGRGDFNKMLLIMKSISIFFKKGGKEGRFNNLPTLESIHRPGLLGP
jgi:hypothetical protein